tara:strand:+ start:1748 stop:2527 length:780 start_codon:yes stop_codon:yes gene_type:complete
MATGFFKNIPNTVYDFKSDGNFQQTKDMFRKVSTWSYLQDGITGYSFYRIIEGERPDVVAAKLYGDSTLYWLFFLVNENLQDLSDWPKSNFQFNKFMDRKYPGTCLESSSSTDIVSYDHSLADRDQLKSRKFYLGEKISQSSDIYGFITDINPTHNRITLNSVNGIFTAGGTATGTTWSAEEPVDGPRSFTISSVVSEQNATHHYLDSNDFKTTVATGNTEVTNIEYERTINEDKHLIRYIEPQYTAKVISEFKELMSD